MASLLFSTNDKCVSRYDKVIRYFFQIDGKAYRKIKNDIENNEDTFSQYLSDNYDNAERHKINLGKAFLVTVAMLLATITILLTSIEVFFHYTSLERKLELTGMAIVVSIVSGVFSIPFFYKDDTDVDNIDTLVNNAKYCIYTKQDSVLLKLSKESSEISNYLDKMGKITIFHYYGVMLYAHKERIPSDWKW